MFAIVAVKNKQYQVTPGQILQVDKLAGVLGETVVFDRVLLTHDGKVTQIGDPQVAGAQVKAKIVKHFKGEKLTVRRYKSKVRYRKATGFRPSLTELEIISVG